ncbi:sugar phosphate isomerase/epimerase [Puia sp.]|jgi:sugar phosphate isomerase/epimerase|uniref:sugar phosphate isomerase/epimerase family protein n=1 Tax=Puia sp. TaxID=2045100 RepID=UPI002F3FADA4
MVARRKFIQTVGLGFAGLKMPAIPAAVPDAAPLKLGIAGYSFAHVPIDQGIAMMKRVGIDALSIKDFYLPLDSDAAAVKGVVNKFSAAGIRIYAAGVIYMKTRGEVDRAFEYAKMLGIDLIIGVPNPELLAYMEEKVKSTNIRVAVHNHGPGDLYPTPVEVYEHIKGLDRRIGLCVDIGHTARAGADPVKMLRDYAPRVLDLHLKDLSVITKEEHAIDLGTGVLDIVGVLRTLRHNRYTGYCSIEHELDMNDPLPGIAESAGYFRGVVKTLN